MTSLQGRTVQALERSMCDLEDRIWRRTIVEQGAAAEATGSWMHVVNALAPEHQEVLAAKARGLQPSQAAAVLGLTPLEVWDQTLEAEAVVRRVAGLPDLNPALERQMQAVGLWPAEAAPLPVDMGEVILRMSWQHRLVIAAKVTERRVTTRTLQPWGIKLPNYYYHLHIVQPTLKSLASAFGVVSASDDRLFNWAIYAIFGSNCRLKEIAKAAGISWWDNNGYRTADFPKLWAAAGPFMQHGAR